MTATTKMQRGRVQMEKHLAGSLVGGERKQRRVAVRLSRGRKKNEGAEIAVNTHCQGAPSPCSCLSKTVFDYLLQSKL